MTEVAPIPLPPLDDIDGIFDLPDSVFGEDDPLRRLHAAIVARLRRELAEALGKQPSTIQTLVAERTAFNYILIKKTEQYPVGVKVKVGPVPAEGQSDQRETAVLGFAHMTASKEFNAFWLGLAETLNKMMLAGQQEFRENMMRSAAKAINEVLAETIEDPNDRAAIRQRIAGALTAATA